MKELGYWRKIWVSKDKKFIRYQMVNHAKEYGIKPTARAFNTNVKTVRKWLRRWKSGTMEGLEEQSRAPKNPSIRITKAQRNKVIELKKKMTSFGAKRLKRDYIKYFILVHLSYLFRWPHITNRRFKFRQIFMGSLHHQPAGGPVILVMGSKCGSSSTCIFLSTGGPVSLKTGSK